MPKDLFEEYGIEAKEEPRDLFEGMDMKDLSSNLNRQEGNSIGILNFLKGLGVGALESVANIAPSVANVALGPIDYFAGTNLKRPYLSLEEFRPQTTGGHLGHLAGNIAGLVVPGGAGAKLISKLLGRPSVLKSAAALGGANAAISGSENELLSRGLAGLTGIIPLAQGLRTKPLIEKAVERNKTLGNQFKEQYESFFNKAESSLPKGEEIRVPKIINSKAGNNALSEIKGLKKAVKQFTLEPTLRNAHKAQSDIGKSLRAFEATNRGKILPSYQTEAIRAAEKIQDNIRAAMRESFAKHGHKELSNEYDFLTKEYADKMVPYLGKALTSHIKNPQATPAKKVLQEMRMKQGEIGKGEYYKDLPGFKYKNNAEVILPPLLKYVGGPALGLEGVKLLSEYLK